MEDVIKDTSIFTESYFLDLFNINLDIVEEYSTYRDIDGFYINIKLNKQEHYCPACQNKTTKVKSYTDKKIKHSILSGDQCIINYKARRYVCSVCKKTFYENNPFVLDNSKMSLKTVYNVLTDLKSCTETFTSVAKRYFISPTSAANVFDKHVAISRRTLPEVLSIDEVYAFKNNRSSYVCVLVDFKSQNLVDVLPSRRKDDLLNYFQYIPRSERDNVKFVSIDMWESYRSIQQTIFPQAKLIVDKFHVIQELTRALSKIRCSIQREIKNSINQLKNSEDYETNKDNKGSKLYKDIELLEQYYYTMKKFNFLLFKTSSPDPNAKKRYNRVFKRYMNYYDLLDFMLEHSTKLKITHHVFYQVTKFFETSTIDNAKERLNNIIDICKATQIPELTRYANTLIRWKSEIINSFTVIDEKTNQKIHNGIIENRNKTIKTLKRNANGYNNWFRFRNRVLYVCNKDATYHAYPINGHKKNE